MRIFRAIVVYLVLALVCSPAMAAYCATACAADPLITNVDPDGFQSSLSNHDNQLAENSSEIEPSKEDPTCALGVGCCHIFQATQATQTTEHLDIDQAKIRFHRFNPSQNSADLSPPLKPPA